VKSLIHHAHLISPDVEIHDAAVLIERGRIAGIFRQGDRLPEADRIIDAAGKMLLPGFIDIHSHGADGRDVNDASLDSVRHIARKKLQEGVTTWLPTTLTQPPDRLAEIVSVCAEYIAAADFCKAPGIHLEGPFIAPGKTGAQNPRFVRPPNSAEFENLNRLGNILIHSLAPEVPGALDLIATGKRLGIVSSAAHSAATFFEIQIAKQAGLTHLTHFGNAMSPLHHREIGVVGAGLLDDDLKLELICDGIHLAPEMIRLVFKTVAIDRLMLITDSIAASWIGEGEVQLGGLEVTVVNGSARLKESGELAGSTLRLNEAFQNVAAITGLPLHQLVKTTSWNQAQSLGLADLGKIEIAYWADLVILNPDFSVWKTLVNGEVREAD
jgi:N-acetylglucosamine-6-phosphate deacetylase